MSHQRVVIVGGGVVGTACAWYLVEAGAEVTVIDQGYFDDGCSHGNCGFVCPSHILPLAEPGAVKHALQAMLRPHAPLLIKPRWDWSLWMWFFSFARRCNTEHMLAAGRALHPLLQTSRTEYLQLMQAGVIDCDAESRGLLFAYQDPKAFAAYAQTDRLLRDTFSHPAVRYDGDEVSELEPALRKGLAGGWHYPDDLHLDPSQLMRTWHASLRERNVGMVGGCAIDRIDSQRDRAVEITGSGQAFAADTYIFATGAMTPQLGRQLRFVAPIQPGKGYCMTFPRIESGPAIPLIFPDTHVAVTPLRESLRLGSTMEFAGYDSSLPAARLQLLREGAAGYLTTPIPQGHAQPWYGWRPMTYDGLPMIGRLPAYKNVWLAAGHNMLGLSTAAATGRLISQLIMGAPPLIDPAPYSVTRFMCS